MALGADVRKLLSPRSASIVFELWQTSGASQLHRRLCLRGIGILMGSVLIDRPLAIYRLHGMNVFSKHPHLYGILNYERGGPADNDLLGRKLVIGHLIDSAKLFLRKLESPQQYM